MARVWGPLFSLDARGQLGKAVVYMNWKGLSTVRIWTRPYNPNSAAQQAQRLKFQNAVLGWQSLSEGQKAAWNAAAEKISTNLHPLSGFNYFMREYCEENGFPPEP